MKDKLLHTFRREPNEEFSNNLYQRLTVLPPAEAVPRSTSPRKIRLAWACASLLLMLSVMAMVPAVRTHFEEIVKEIGGLTVRMTDIYHDTSDANIVPNDTMSLSEARERTGLDFELPTWLPEGLTMRDDVIVSNIRTQITISWTDENKRGHGLMLDVGYAEPDINLLVGPDSVTEVMIHDTPATLIRGGWFENTRRWEEDGPRSLRWQANGLEYTLSTMMPEWGGLTEDELILIAESFPQNEATSSGQ